MNAPLTSHQRRITLGAKPEWKKDAPNKPRTAVGHDATLKKLQDSGGTIKLIMISGRHYKGTVIGRDRYTIVLKTAEDKSVTIYKHAIEAFVPQEAA